MASIDAVMVSVMILGRLQRLHADHSSEVEGICVHYGHFLSLIGEKSDKSRARAVEKLQLREAAQWKPSLSAVRLNNMQCTQIACPHYELLRSFYFEAAGVSFFKNIPLIGMRKQKAFIRLWKKKTISLI